MIRVYNTKKLSVGEEVLVRLRESNCFGSYFVKEIKDQFVGLATMKHTHAYNFYDIGEIELYKH